MVRRFCAVDAEGDAGEKGLLGVAFYSDDRQLWLTDRGEILDALLWHAKHGYTFIAHNAEYDLPVIWWQLQLDATSISYNRTFNHGEWRYGAGSRVAQIWDCLNLCGGLSLTQLGETLHLPKYTMPQILRGIDPDRWEWICETHQQGECLSCYAIRDAEIVHRYITTLAGVVETWGATVQRRIGATGMAVWRALDRPQPIRLRDRRAAYLGRQAYYGGRVECFKLGHFGPLYAADVSSMYPSVMVETPFPDPRTTVTLDNVPVHRVPWDAEGAADVTVYVPHVHVPPLPNSHRGERVFATGLQRGVWTLLELRYAISSGCVVRAVHRLAFSPNAVFPFTLFVGTLWELRQSYLRDRDHRAQAVKSMLNETYGRFALNSTVGEERIGPMPPGAASEDHRGCRHFGSYGIYMCGKQKPKHFEHTWSNELWAAQITAAARVKLHRHLIAQGDNLVYCDTDSVFSQAPIVGLGEGLGQLTGEVLYDKAWIVGPKLYRLEPMGGDAVVRAKGIPRDLADDFLRGKQVWFDRPISPHQMMEGKGTAGAWHTLTRERGLALYRRQPQDPAKLDLDWGWTTTVAPVFGAG